MSCKIRLEDIPSEYLWQWLQDRVANKCYGVPYESLTELKKRKVFSLFAHMLNDNCKEEFNKATKGK